MTSPSLKELSFGKRDRCKNEVLHLHTVSLHSYTHTLVIECGLFAMFLVSLCRYKSDCDPHPHGADRDMCRQMKSGNTTANMAHSLQGGQTEEAEISMGWRGSDSCIVEVTCQVLEARQIQIWI